jgi:zinc protease
VDLALADLPAVGTGPLIPEVKPVIADAIHVLRKDIPQSSVLLAAYGIKREDPDYYAAVVLNSVLGGASFMSRLWNEVREERGLAYSVSTSNSALQHSAYFAGYVATNNEQVAESVRIIRDEIERITREGVTPDELTAAKVYLIGSFALSLDTNARIARTLVSMQISDLGPDYIDKRVDYYNAVTQDDIKRVARRIFLGDANATGAVKLTTTIIGDPKNIAATPPPKNG